MTKHITRYLLKEIKALRFTKKGTGKVVEVQPGEFLRGTDGPEFNDNRVLEDIQQFQRLLVKLSDSPFDIEIEMDFED